MLSKCKCFILGKQLEGITYFHPLEDKKLPFLAAQHVTMNLGTGLVHTAPAHGSEDFLVAIENKISVVSYLVVIPVLFFFNQRHRNML